VPLIFACVFSTSCLCFSNQDDSKEPNDEYYHKSVPWETAINLPEEEEKYPERKKVTSERMRLAIDEYYIPDLSELLCQGLDYLEWIQTLDDPYFNKYKLDLKLDPDDERLKLYWKNKF